MSTYKPHLQDMYSIVNLSQDQSKENKYLSTTLLKKIQKNITKSKKIILYINRRGEFTGIVCKNCQYIYKCAHCDSSLTVYANKILRCHTCWYTEGFPIACKICQWNELEQIGVWIEQIEQKVKILFPWSKVFRFDSDSIKTKEEKRNVLQSLDEAEIILGTKMITTGFDLKNIGLIWVILLEQELIFPQFDTEEKLFSTMKQLFWRAKRWDNIYEWVIQTFIPNNPLIQQITEWNYAEFFVHTLKERKIFWYPPYQECAILEYRHKNKESAHTFISKLKEILSQQWKDNLEIYFPEISRKRYNQFHFSLFIKWKNLREKLEIIKKEVILNPWLTLEFQ